MTHDERQLLHGALLAAFLSALGLTAGCAGEVDAPMPAPYDDTMDSLAPTGRFADRLDLSNPTASSACANKHETPMLREQILARGHGPGLTKRARANADPRAAVDPDEEDGGLDPTALRSELDDLDLGAPLPPIEADSHGAPVTEDLVVVQPMESWAFWFADSDGDCLINIAEIYAGTNYLDPDSDDDGWFDGPCNERRSLVLTRIVAHDEQEDFGEDEFYVIADDVRYPSSDLDDWWDFDDGDAKNFSTTIATRTRGVNTTASLASVRFEGWEDDYETWNEWTVDDLLGYGYLDLGAYVDGQSAKLRFTADDWDYELSFRVDISYFADPTPTENADSDADGIADSDEYAVARYLGGIADPTRKDIFVEVDAMSGRSLHTNAKRLVATQYHRHGYHLYIWRHQANLPHDGCLTVAEARDLYHTYFHRKNFNAFRYAVVGEELWNDASGVAWNDTFFIDDSTWWIEDDVLAQAATFQHELGHTMSLRKPHYKGDTGPGTYKWIDTVAWLSYYSAMNYTYQPTLVDYSDEGEGGDTSDHDDWEDIDPAWGLRYSFGSTTSTTTGHCG